MSVRARYGLSQSTKSSEIDHEFSARSFRSSFEMGPCLDLGLILESFRIFASVYVGWTVVVTLLRRRLSRLWERERQELEHGSLIERRDETPRWQLCVGQRLQKKETESRKPSKAVCFEHEEVSKINPPLPGGGGGGGDRGRLKGSGVQMRKRVAAWLAAFRGVLVVPCWCDRGRKKRWNLCKQTLLVCILRQLGLPI